MTLGGGDSRLVEVYERVFTGLGDGIMLRPAIIANMKRYPERRHVLHIYSGISCIFEDIDNLEIVPIIHPDYINDNSTASQYRYDLSLQYIKNYNISNVYKLSQPCADYESYNSPFTVFEKRRIKIRFNRQREYWPRKYPALDISKEEYHKAISTGKKIIKSRQQIFCEVVGVPFSLDNYDVKFTDEELQIADSVINGSGDVIGIHMRSSTHQRDYKYMIGLVDYVASKVNAVITFDASWRYSGRRSNVISDVGGVRRKWAIMTKLKMLIGPDSFAIHAAGSLGIPTYGMFGPTDPKCRLTDYAHAAWSDKWRLPILRRGFRLGCGRQYCWYKPCKTRMCLNARSPQYYWDDAIEKLEGVMQ